MNALYSSCIYADSFSEKHCPVFLIEAPTLVQPGACNELIEPDHEFDSLSACDEHYPNEPNAGWICSELSAAIERMTSVTKSIFSRNFEIVEQDDPEIEKHRYFVFRVVDSGDMSQILARQDAWHERLIEISPDLRGSICLSIDVRS